MVSCYIGQHFTIFCTFLFVCSSTEWSFGLHVPLIMYIMISINNCPSFRWIGLYKNDCGWTFCVLIEKQKKHRQWHSFLFSCVFFVIHVLSSMFPTAIKHNLATVSIIFVWFSCMFGFHVTLDISHAHQIQLPTKDILHQNLSFYQNYHAIHT